MIKLHRGADVRGVTFDAVSLSTDDSARFFALNGESAMTAEAMRAALARLVGLTTAA